MTLKEQEANRAKYSASRPMKVAEKKEYKPRREIRKFIAFCEKIGKLDLTQEDHDFVNDFFNKWFEKTFSEIKKNAS